MSGENKETQHNLQTGMVLGLSMTAGLGLTLMILALALGVVQGESADSRAVGLLFLTGLFLLLGGIAGWFGVVQPQKHFDDINVPQDNGHDHENEHHSIEPV